ncbi:arabinose transporter [Methylobacillus sp. Pita1]|uniref:arabinose transporter n=1 Tax=Methylobacillus sp. Pita1 TaxID=3382642 RepID=UPI0038B55D24
MKQHHQKQESSISALSPPVTNVLMKVLPIVMAVFVGFLTIGIQLPVLPLHLHEGLGMGTLVVGMVIGSEFVAALLTRAWAGNYADMRGAKRAMLLGTMMAACSGMVYLISLAFVETPEVSVWILLGGRILLALGQSLLVTGSMSWGIGLVGPKNAGKVMAWNGIAMYGAYAIGAPLGVAMNSEWGFQGIAVAIFFIPLLALAITVGTKGVVPTSDRRIPFYKVLSAVWLPGLGLALSSVGFGVISAFIALLFAAKHWGHSSIAFAVFGLAFIGARIFFGHLPDKIGGAKVALVSVMIEAGGQFLIWGSDMPEIAYVGAALTGFGYSLAFPGFGVEALRRAPPQTRGLAMGAYAAFLDLSLGIATPLAGAIANAWSVGSVYLVGAISVGLSIFVAIKLLNVASVQHG